MTGLVIEEINEIKKIVNFTVCYYIGVINDEKKDEVLALIQALTSNHISILLSPINITDYLTDLFSNNEIMAILIYFHNKFHAELPYGNPNFSDRLNQQLIKTICIFNENANNVEVNEFQRLHFNAFNNFYANKDCIIDYITKFPIVLTLIMLSVYIDPQRFITHATSLKKSRDKI